MNTQNLFSLHQKNIILTGATGILGQHFCRALATAGAHLIIADLDQNACDTFAKKLSTEFPDIEIAPLAVDLADENSVIDWRKKIYSQFKKIDVLINNAACKSKNFFAPLKEFSLEDWNQVMDVNVTGAFLCAREIGSRMAEQGNGSIINIGSIYGVLGPDQRIYEGSWYEKLGGTINTPLVYSASKGALIAMTRYLATYWGHKGVRTNTLSPGGVSSGQNSEFSQKYSQRVPLDRMAQPDDLIGALLFLASDASAYVNGQNLLVDGGLSAW
jgi:NAD(P)-dependent dehydrogenase (short-subunit alcohol dehydrogenase family)